MEFLFTHSVIHSQLTYKKFNNSEWCIGGIIDLNVSIVNSVELMIIDSNPGFLFQKKLLRLAITAPRFCAISPKISTLFLLKLIPTGMKRKWNPPKILSNFQIIYL